MLSVLLGATLLASPLLVGSAPTTDQALIAAMATINDVRDSLEEKRGLLSDALEQAKLLEPGSAEWKRLERSMALHFQNARDIQELALSFLGASSQRYPEYSRYWNSYRERLQSTWRNVSQLHELLATGPDKAVADEPAPQDVSAPFAAAAKRAPESVPPASPQPEAAAETEVRAESPAEPDQGQKAMMSRYRQAYQLFSEGTTESVEKARATFAALLAEEPAFHLARYWMARILLQQGNPVEARRHARILVGDQPGLRMARALLKSTEEACSQASTGEARAASLPNAGKQGRLSPLLGGQAIGASGASHRGSSR
jgi:TolA-binding protein